jgi:hypothetical protein
VQPKRHWIARPLARSLPAAVGVVGRVELVEQREEAVGQPAFVLELIDAIAIRHGPRDFGHARCKAQ